MATAARIMPLVPSHFLRNNFKTSYIISRTNYGRSFAPIWHMSVKFGVNLLSLSFFKTTCVQSSNFLAFYINIGKVGVYNGRDRKTSLVM